MDTDVIKTEEVAVDTLPVEAGVPAQENKGREFKKNSRKGAPRREARVKPEFDQKLIGIRRVTRSFLRPNN
jgi:hypothetical protein